MAPPLPEPREEDDDAVPPSTSDSREDRIVQGSIEGCGVMNGGNGNDGGEDDNDKQDVGDRDDPDSNNTEGGDEDDDDDDDVTIIVLDAAAHSGPTASGGYAPPPMDEATRRTLLLQELRHVQRASFIHFALLGLIPAVLLVVVIVTVLTDHDDCASLGLIGLGLQCQDEPRSFLNAFTTRCICDSIAVSVVPTP